MGKSKSAKDRLMFRHLFFIFCFIPIVSFAQIQWQNVDSLYQPLPKSVHVFYTDTPIDTSKFRAFYVIADLKDKNLEFTTDTTYKRRLTPSQFFQRNKEPLVVVNGTFFSFETHQNLNVVIKDSKLVSLNAPEKTKDSVILPSYKSALGINRKRFADIAWIKTDSNKKYAKAAQMPYTVDGNFFKRNLDGVRSPMSSHYNPFSKWKVVTAIGGGPVLLQNGEIRITNNEEKRFAGKAINDKHPRTAMGYTKDNKLIILVIEGRNPNAGGANLTQEAQILKDLGCTEALNLDGGGSSCLLINGKETIQPSDKTQRAVPAVFIIKKK
jgi:exopolysaccharide biosynthesis protein